MRKYDVYKPSGINWIGDVPADWQVKKLKYLVDLVNEPAESNSFVVAVENIESKTGKLINLEETKTFQSSICGFREGDVLFNKLRPYLAKVYYAEKNGGCVGELLILRSREEIYDKFLYYRVSSSAFIDVVDSSTNGTKMPRANWDGFINQLLIPYPSDIDEQTAIADYLDEKTARIDELIAGKQRLIDLLKEERLAVINHAVTRGINPDAKLKPSGITWLGDIPEHWEVKRLKYISPKIMVGLVINPSTYFEVSGTVPMLTGKNVTPNKINLNSANLITPESNEILYKTKLDEGDVVVVRVGYPGTAAVVKSSAVGANCASMMIIKNGSFNSDFLSFCFNSAVGKSQVEMVEYGAAQKQFNISDAIEFRFPSPTLEEQKQIVDFIEAETSKIDRTTDKIQNEIDLIREYRTALISEVVTGNIKVV